MKGSIGARPLPAGRAVLAAFALSRAVPGAAPAAGEEVPQRAEAVRTSGYVFGDVYWFAADHDPAVEGANGLWFRRIYLTFDRRIGPALSSRLRLEFGSPGDFDTNRKIEPFVKDASLRWKLGGSHALVLGLSGTPTLGVVEAWWGYRPVEKTPLDLHRLGSSRDIGIALEGTLGAASRFGYHLMVANGAGTGSETDSGKKAMLSLSFCPTGRVVAEAYGDFEKRPGRRDRWTIQGFLAVKGTWGRLGLQAARQRREAGAVERDLDLASAFAVLDVHPRARLLGRVDRMLDPNPDGAAIAYLPFDATAAATFAVAGIEVEVDERFRVIPNVELVHYADPGGGRTRPGDDLVVRTTFFFRF